MFTQSAIVVRCALHLTRFQSSFHFSFIFSISVSLIFHNDVLCYILSLISLCNILRRRGSLRLPISHAVSPCDEGTACLKVHFERGNTQVFSATKTTAINY